MNFSDETVGKVAKAIYTRANVPSSYDYSSLKDWQKTNKTKYLNDAKAALSSLTLADLMHAEEVRALVEQANWAAKLLEKCEPYLIELGKRLGAAPSPLLQVGHAVNQIRKATAQFTEAK